jgi:hypothetical protein
MGGYSALLYKVEGVDIHSATGYGAGLGYTYIFGNHYDVRVGAEAAFAATSAYIDNLHASYKTYAPEGDIQHEIIFNSDYAAYNETQKIVYLNLPVMAGYHSAWLGDVNFYAQAGIKLGASMPSKYNITADKLTTHVNVPEWEEELWNNEQHNLGEQTMLNRTMKITMRVNIAAAVEAGIKWRLYPQWMLYTGAYFDYGIFNIAPQSEGALVTVPLSRRSDFTYNSLLNATTNGERYTNKVNMMQIGLRIGIAWKNDN